MAKMVQCDRSLYKEYDKARKKCKISLICTGVSFVLFAVMGYINVETYGRFFFVMPILVVCFLASGIMAGRFSQQAQIIAVGLEGEKKTSELLRVLPDSYYCFQNLKIRHGDGVSEIDAAVVGPTGVFVIETKNLNGNIVGNYANRDWVQHKVGRRGTPYSKVFHSPVKQVGTQVHRLAGFLKDNRTGVYVESAVFFTNPAAMLQLSGVPSKTPVFSQSAGDALKLITFIADRETKLTETEVRNIAKLLGA